MRFATLIIALAVLSTVGARSIPIDFVVPFADGQPGVNRPRRPATRPDIVLVTIDALRADHLSSYGYRRLTSPAIDRLAAQSVRFTEAVTQAPYTKAAVASLMTSLYPSAHGATTSTVPFPETMTGAPTSAPATTDILSPHFTTLAEVLQAAGYRTLGFTANPFLIAPFGFGQGFDEFEFFPGADFASADHVAARALSAVQHSGAGPIFLWVHLMEPHSSYAPPAETRGMFPVTGPAQPLPASMVVPGWLLKGSPRDLRPYEAAYDEEIAAADVAVDHLLRQLAVLRNPGNTVVVLTADHGEEFLDHGGWEHSDSLYDELIRVPLAIKAPGVAPRATGAQVQLVDIFPTIVELAGAEVPEGTVGHSLTSVLRGRDESRSAFSEIANAEYALRADGWKVIVFADGRVELFNLDNDPREQHNLAAEEPARTARMRQQADQYHATAVAAHDAAHDVAAPIDPVLLERLRSLGYVSGAGPLHTR